MAAKSKSMTTRVWVSRDKDSPGNLVPYSIRKTKPILDDGYWMPIASGIAFGIAYETKGFHRLTGFRLKPGECRQVDMTISMVPVEGGE